MIILEEYNYVGTHLFCTFFFETSLGSRATSCFKAFVGAPPLLPLLWTTRLPPVIIDDDGQVANSAESDGDKDNGDENSLFAKMPPRPCIHNKKMNILCVFL